MTLQEIFNRVLTESGQFLLAPDEIEVNPDRFLILIKSALGMYSKYSPIENRFNIEATARMFPFNAGTKDSLNNPIAPFNYSGIPDGIADVVPVRIAGISPYFLRDFEGHKSDYLNEKAEYPWEYRKPRLYVPLQGTLDIHAWWRHQVVSTSNEDNTQSFDIPSITDLDDNFFGFLTAKCLRALGHSRKAFTIEDLPLTTDGPELVTAGKDMEEDYTKRMQDESKFWLAWG